MDTPKCAVPYVSAYDGGGENTNTVSMCMWWVNVYNYKFTCDVWNKRIMFCTFVTRERVPLAIIWKMLWKPIHKDTGVMNYQGVCKLRIYVPCLDDKNNASSVQSTKIGT